MKKRGGLTDRVPKYSFNLVTGLEGSFTQNFSKPIIDNTSRAKIIALSNSS